MGWWKQGVIEVVKNIDNRKLTLKAKFFHNSHMYKTKVIIQGTYNYIKQLFLSLHQLATKLKLPNIPI